MKLIPVIERDKWRKIGGKTKGQRWNFDPAVDDFLYISDPEVAKDLVRSGHWQEYEEPKTKRGMKWVEPDLEPTPKAPPSFHPVREETDDGD